ncbi:hypothetical protein MA16_Dca028083 [Dendrobium catenatum]|uniref:Uncharacterized protein n=1 Tax=Dendrobium catenatum TaxID=906689 RepID=A0A2I0VD44_9ASPA|nr:hypothetical protein MA16_Dca028083 [Dendrobium catenatum]
MIFLRGASDHVLNKVKVYRSINDSAIVLGGLKLPKSNVARDSTLTFCLQLVKNPSILECSLVYFSCFLLESLYHTFANPTKLIDEMPSSFLLARVDMANDHHVDMNLLLTHGYLDVQKLKGNGSNRWDFGNQRRILISSSFQFDILLRSSPLSLNACSSFQIHLHSFAA